MDTLPDRVLADLRAEEARQDAYERAYDPTDLSEITEEEVSEAFDHAPAKVMSGLMQDIRSEDWDMFGLRFRRMLIDYRAL